MLLFITSTNKKDTTGIITVFSNSKEKAIRRINAYFAKHNYIGSPVFL